VHGAAVDHALRLRRRILRGHARKLWHTDAGRNDPDQRCGCCRDKARLGYPLGHRGCRGWRKSSETTSGSWVGREFGEPLLDKWGHLVRLDPRKRMLGRYLFSRYGGSIVFFGRFIALLRVFAAVLAGANGLAPWRFFVFNALGAIVWATVFGLGGYLLGASIHRIAGPMGWLMLGLAVLAAILFWRYFKHHEERLLAAAEYHSAKYDRR
jgi:hypothetical protein